MKFALFIGFFIALIYLSQLLVIWTNQILMNEEMELFCFILPAIIIIVVLGLIFLGKSLYDSIYSIIYFICMLYAGYLLYITQVALLIRIILIFYKIPKEIGMGILYGLPFLITLYGFINAKITKIVNLKFKYPGYKGKITILHLSDIHLGAIHQKSNIERIVEEIKQLKPDMVAITGDLADGSMKVKYEWLEPFNDLSIPIFYVSGNHELMNPKLDMIKVIYQTNIKYIGNHERFEYKGVNIIGEDFEYDLDKVLDDIELVEGKPNILLYHVPLLKPEELKKYNIFLMLAGHTHGGQVFPFHIPAYLSNACFSGLYSDKEKKHHVFVSEGVNNACCPIRVGSSRIFALITITG